LTPLSIDTILTKIEAGIKFLFIISIGC
jgi:hypothetical protein